MNYRKPPGSDISREERKALGDLRKDDGIEIFPGDKGKCTLILNKEEYI